MNSIVETEVLIVGSGPAGSSAALFLATLGVKTLVVNKYHWTARTPRAHLTNQRTMETFRDYGIEQQAIQDATPHELLGDTVFCTSLQGDELGRIKTWGTHPSRHADYVLASPTMNCDLPQNYLEPILVKNAASRGANFRFSHEYVSHVQDQDGVTTTVRDRLSGQEYQVRSQYLIGADGARSAVAEDLGLPFEGKMDLAGSMNITFTADLSPLCVDRPSVLYWVLQPGSSIGGIGMGVVRMVRPWNEWLAIWGYDISQPPPEVDEEKAIEIVRNLVGDPDLDVEITGTSLWSVNHMHATRMQEGRVFIAGDAAHRHPPSNGLGSNTSIQDSYNLAWKLAAVLKGQAEPSLLDTYSQERAPIAKQIVDRANKSGEEFAPIFEALGVAGIEDPEVMRANIEVRKNHNATGLKERAALMKAIDLKNYEFNTHGVELGQRYRSDAIIPDGTEEPAFTRDPELYYHATTWPGARLPHVWVLHRGTKISTLDIAGRDRWALLTGIDGAEWAKAGQAAAQAAGIELVTAVVGPGQDYQDPYFDWAHIREIPEHGAILVRPDNHVAWRTTQSPGSDAQEHISAALAAVLGKQPVSHLSATV